MANAAVQTAVEISSPAPEPKDVPVASSTGEATTNFDTATIAYRLWEERGRPEGDPDRDWYEAERQRQAENAA